MTSELEINDEEQNVFNKSICVSDTPSNTMPPPSLAVIISGQARTFTSKQVRQSIRRNLLDGLCPSLSECTFELFFCVGLGTCNSVYMRSNFGPGPAPALRLEELRAAWSETFADLPIGHLVWPVDGSCSTADELLHCTARDRRWCNGTRPLCDGEVSPALKQGVVPPPLPPPLTRIAAERVARWRRIEEAVALGKPFQPPPSLLGMRRWLRCWPHVLARERIRPDGKFSWIAVVRPDVGYFLPFLPLSQYTRRPGVHVPANHYSPLCDLFALMVRRHAEAYLSAVSQLCCMNECYWSAPVLPWVVRAARRERIDAPVMHSSNLPTARQPLASTLTLPAAQSRGPEDILATQLYVNDVPVYGGFVPFSLVRRRAGGGPGKDMYVGECWRHEVCNTTTSALVDFGIRGWPECPTDRATKCRHQCWSARCSRATRLRLKCSPSANCTFENPAGVVDEWEATPVPQPVQKPAADRASGRPRTLWRRDDSAWARMRVGELLKLRGTG